jgi:hypothetical protein
VLRFGRFALTFFEIAILTALILVTRCANYREVLVAGNVYFTDADCYARMTRVRMCAEHPGLIVRHHFFENYPAGTNPHTTAPLDYLILALSIPLRGFTTQWFDLAGALISPVFALFTGWFLWWWYKRMRFRYGWIALILYVISPILVHGAALGRPDHQSLLILLIAIGICALWGWRTEISSKWSILSGIAWSLALWISAYEPLLLLLLLLGCQLIPWRQLTLVLFHRHSPERCSDHPSEARTLLSSKEFKIASIIFAAILAVAILVERRLPGLTILRPNLNFVNWAHTIGELRPVSPLNPVWLRWAGYSIAFLPLLIAIRFWKTPNFVATIFGARHADSSAHPPAPAPVFLFVLLLATYGLTIWQARWAYFFVIIVVIILPALLQPIGSAVTIWAVFALASFPILRDWDDKLWPNEAEFSRRVESRVESAELRELSVSLRSPEVHPFLATWWLSPPIAYWSGQPGVAGSSHESLDGIADSARFFLADEWQKPREIVENHKVRWVVAYDADRTAAVSAAILGEMVPEHALCYVLERAPAQAPRFLVFSAQNRAAKLFRVAAVAKNSR